MPLQNAYELYSPLGCHVTRITGKHSKIYYQALQLPLSLISLEMKTGFPWKKPWEVLWYNRCSSR